MGDASISIDASHYLDDVHTNSLSLRGEVDVRIFRGFSVNAGAQLEWISDQIYLAADDGLTIDEILLRTRQRGTDFSSGIQLGFSFQSDRSSTTS